MILIYIHFIIFICKIEIYREGLETLLAGQGRVQEISQQRKVETVAQEGTALGFAIFPMIFTYKRDAGIINSDVIIRFSLIAGKLSPSIKIILGIQCD